MTGACLDILVSFEASELGTSECAEWIRNKSAGDLSGHLGVNRTLLVGLICCKDAQ